MKLSKGKRLKPVLHAGNQSDLWSGALTGKQVNVSFVWGKKSEEGDPEFALGVIVSDAAPDVTEDCSILLGTRSPLETTSQKAC